MTRVPMWVVECAAPDCALQFETRAYAKPRGVYCSLDCWQRHHKVVDQERQLQREAETLRTAAEVRLVDARFQRGACLADALFHRPPHPEEDQ